MERANLTKMKVVELRQIMKKNGQDPKGAKGRKGTRGEKVRENQK